MLSATQLSTLAGYTVTAEQAAATVAVASALAKSYTRGKGFDPDPAEDIEAVIATASLRMLVNPSGLQDEQMGALRVRYGSNFLGWSLTELAVLNRYRERAK